MLRLVLLALGRLVLPARPAEQPLVRSLRQRFSTVELNAPFYSWPTLATINTWKRQVGRRKFTYAIKVNELIAHTRRFVAPGRSSKTSG
jgi:uncharacterized protein YecE (DUF72 family)